MLANPALRGGTPPWARDEMKSQAIGAGQLRNGPVASILTQRRARKRRAGQGTGRSWIVARLIKYLIYVVIFCGIVVAGYALVFDLPAPQTEISVPVNIDIGG